MDNPLPETKDETIQRLQRRLQALELMYSQLHDNFSSRVKEETRKSISSYKKHMTKRERHIELLERKLNAISKACKLYNNVGIVGEYGDAEIS